MNEKTKTILRYAAVGLGGLALGIGLLGGLAMCASSGNRSTAESVNTILNKKNAKGTTAQGGYDKYTFSVSLDWYTDDLTHGKWDVYSFDTSTATLTSVSSTLIEGLGTGRPTISDAIINNYDAVTVPANEVYFCVGYFYTAVFGGSSPYTSYYSSFKLGSTNLTGTDNIFYNNYIWLNDFTIGYNLLDGRYVWGYGGNKPSNKQLITYGRTSYVCFSGTNSTAPTLSYQDTASYYLEQGYSSGYEEGTEAGESAGYSSGYAEGYEAGESAGYSSGYAEGFRTGYMNTYYAFTSLTANLNKVWNMAEIPWHRNTDILVTQDNFNDFPFFDIAHLQVGIYINWAYLALFRDTVTLTPYYVYAQRYTTSQNDGYNVCINIAPASQDTIQEDGNIGGTTGPYLLQEDSLFQLSHTTVWTAPNRCRLIGFMDDTEDIYTDWFDDGYLIPQGIEIDGNAYEEGYRQGQHDATNDTDIQNVFSLLTPAFTAVGGFFNLKVFGFLPLYWFFLAPLFVALITLILRMVKH